MAYPPVFNDVWSRTTSGKTQEGAEAALHSDGDGSIANGDGHTADGDGSIANGDGPTADGDGSTADCGVEPQGHSSPLQRCERSAGDPAILESRELHPYHHTPKHRALVHHALRDGPNPGGAS